MSDPGEAARDAREAAGRGDWKQAFDLLSAADAEGTLAAGELPLLGEMAYAAGELDATIDAWERAHAAAVRAGDQISAAGAAVRVAMHLLFDTALMAPVRGWLHRADRLLVGHEDSPAHAWLAVVRTYERLLSGEEDEARRWAARAVDLGSRFDAAAGAIARVAEARLVVLGGDVERGLALLDEAGSAAVAGDLDPLSTGLVYCELVCACRAWRSTTPPRNGRRRWSGGATRMRSEASTAVAACTARRSSGCAVPAPMPSGRRWPRAKSSGRICVVRWAGR